MKKHSLPDGFGDRLKEERKALKLNQTDFAEKSGIKRSTQIMYEKETSYPNYKYLKAISELGVDVRYLFFGYKSGCRDMYHLTQENMNEIYKTLETIGIGENGKCLPLQKRIEIFLALCSAYSA